MVSIPGGEPLMHPQIAEIVEGLVVLGRKIIRFRLTLAPHELGKLVGLMQVMPFWPRQLGVSNQLVKIAPNIRMGCEILRYYLRVEHHDWTRALARYNGSVGRNAYPALVMQRWQHGWRF